MGRFDFYLTRRQQPQQARNHSNNDSDGGARGGGTTDVGGESNEDGTDNVYDSPRNVLVEFSMTEAGDLRVRVVDDDYCDDDDDNLHGSSSRSSGKGGTSNGFTREEESMQTFLVAAVCVLGLLYLALRLCLRPITDHGDAAITPFS